MTAPRVLVVYASSHGQTRAITEALAARLQEHGLTVVVADAFARRSPPASEFDAAVLGARIRNGKWPRALVRYVDANARALASKPSFLFSVSLSASDKPHVHDPGGYMGQLCFHTLWRPTASAAFAGALRYRRYNPVLRQLVRLQSSRHGRTVDLSRDHEFTDWRQVRGFADEIAGFVEAACHARPIPHSWPSP